MSKGVGIAELTTILTANPRMVGAVREQEKVGFLSTTELEALLAGSVGNADIDADAVTTDNLADGAVTSSKLGDEYTIQYAEVEISSAEILALFTTAKELVASPGAGYVLEFISLLLAYDAGATPYTVVGCTNFEVRITDKTGDPVSVTQAVAGMIDQATDQLRSLDKLEATVTPVDAAVLCLALDGANPLAGDGVIHAKVAYRVHATDLA